MPFDDFEDLLMSLNKMHGDIKLEKGRIIGEKLCSHYNVGLLSFKIQGRYYKIPQLFFTMEIEDSKCLFMFDRNDEYEKTKDDIVTDQGVKDVETNNGYILGMPFLRAFLILFDFEDNTVGFANKRNNFGAFITTKKEDDIAPYEPYVPYDQGDVIVKPGRDQESEGEDQRKDEPSKPGGDGASTGAPTDPDQPGSDTEENDKDEGDGLFVFILVISIVGFTICVLAYYCYNKKQQGNKMFATETAVRDENKDGKVKIKVLAKIGNKRRKSRELSESSIENM